MVPEKVVEATSKLIGIFESGKLPEAIARTTIQAKAGTEIPSSKWSLGNRILMWIAGTQDARGFKQWEQAGRRVKKGAKAFFILGPRMVKVEKQDENGNTVVQTVLRGFLGIPVFRYEDTEGDPLPVADYRPVVLPPLYDVAIRLGVDVKYIPMESNFYGCYSPGTRSISLCTHDVVTFFHELAHVAHNKLTPLRGGQDPSQEIVAEAAAAALCIMYGYDGYLFETRRYIAHYAGLEPQDAAKAIIKVLSDVEKVLALILDTAEKTQELAEPSESSVETGLPVAS